MSTDDVQELVAAARSAGDPATLQYVASVASGLLVRTGHMDEALALQREAVDLGGSELIHAISLVDLGTIHHLRGELTEAERLYQEALAVTPRENVNWFVLMGNIGEAQLDAGRYDEAAAQLRATVAEARGNPVLAAWAFGLLALAEAGRGSPGTALALGRQAEAELEDAMLTDEGIGYVLVRLREVMADLEASEPVRQG
jgi:tetratricopeptide (TPR) repeat protein